MTRHHPQSPSSSANVTQASLTKLLFLSSGIESVLEWWWANAAIGGKEFFAGLAQLHIGVENFLDGVWHFIASKARPEDGANRGIVADEPPRVIW